MALEVTAAPVVELQPQVTSAESSESSIDDDNLIPEDSTETPKEKAKIVEEIKRLKKLKIKYNGKEEEEDLPFEIPDDPKAIEYMQKKLQMAKLGTNKAQEYASLEREVIDFIEELRKDPRKALSRKDINIDLKRLAGEILQEEIENSQKSPELLEKEKLEARLREMENERKLEKDTFRQKELERLQEQEYQRYDLMMDKAFKEAGMPKNSYMTRRVADYMISALNDNMKVDPSDVLPIVREEMLSDLKDMFSVMPAEVLEEMIGKDSLDKIRKHRISKSKPKPPVPVGKSIDTGSKGSVQPEVKKRTIKEMFGV